MLSKVLWQIEHGVWDDLAELFRLRPGLTAEDRAACVLCFWGANS